MKAINYILRIALVLFIFRINSTDAQQNQSGVSHKFPVTNFNFNDDTTKVQFAIVSDLWGGNRQGVFEDAVNKIELLQPQFVISLGDLIDGETYDSSLVEKQWDEFNRKIQPLTMPFFYVPGNHGIANPMMERIWKERFGKAYYYFVYKNVLFLCVNTQDSGRSLVGDQQVAYFKKAIQDHPDVRWTFLFMHRPVWFTNSNHEEGYEKIEAALAGGNYTLFSGHYHTYLNIVKNGSKHFILGTTGGGSDLRGEKFGEFDHITWVTLNNTQPPKIINLKPSGLIREDVVNEKTFPITNTLINEDWLITPSYALPLQFEKSISPKIILNNPTPYPLRVTGTLSKMEGYKIVPDMIDTILPARTKREIVLTINSNDDKEIDISKLSFVEVSLNGSYKYDTTQYELPSKKHLNLFWEHQMPGNTKAKNLSLTAFENGDTSGFTSIINPEYLDNKWYWQGPRDCLVNFNLMHDSKYLYLVALIKDDQVVLEKKNNQRDILYVHFEDKNNIPVKFSILPGLDRPEINQERSAGMLGVKDLQLKNSVRENEIKIFVRVPLNKIMKADHSIRFNIGYRDQDTHPEKEYSILFWKPIWGTEADYKNSGTYILDGKF